MIRVAIEGLALLFVAGTRLGVGWIPDPLRLLLFGAAALFVLVDAAMVVVMPPLVHRRTRYRVDHRGLEIRRGVFWRSVTTVARSRIQHLDVTQGPLERRYGLGRLHVHTAGSQQSTVQLSGLAHETARALRDDLGEWDSAADGV